MKLLTKSTMIVVLGMLSGVMVYAAAEAPLGMPIKKQWKGNNAKQEKPQRLVIKDQKAWEKTWALMKGNIMPKQAAPKIDFNKNMVIAVFMGRKMSGGYSIKVAKIDDKDKLIVTVKESSPPKGGMTTMALTSPYHVVVIAKSAKEVEFKEGK